MKNIKLCYALAAVVIIATIAFVIADKYSCTFEYRHNDNGGITITDYTGNNKSVTIPDTLDGSPVTEIGDYAFLNSQITDVVIPDTVKIIGGGAFSRCEQLSVIDIPKSVERIGAMPFWATPFEKTLGEDEFIIINDSILYKYNGESDIVTIPEGITCIGGYGFYKNNLTEVIIPDSVRYIESQAFAECKSLKSVTVSSAEYIGDVAFLGCTSLETADITAREIDSSAFSGCTSLCDISLKGTCTMGSSVFYKCVSLKEITLPDSLVSMGNAVFKESGLVETDIPKGITEINTDTFKDCTSLSRVGLHSGITAIRESSFSGCTSLTEITLPEGLTFIGETAFYNCGLTSITIPDSVTEVGFNAFMKCTLLSKVKLSKGMTVIPHSCFDGCIALSELIIPDSVTEIRVNAFQNTPRLKTVDLPDGLKILELNCFYNSGIWAVFIPDSVEQFNRQAFLGSGCTLMFTENCKAYQQVCDASQHYLNADYTLRQVSSRTEADAYIKEISEYIKGISEIGSNN